MATAFETFVRTVNALTREAPPEVELIDEVAAELARLNASGRWLPESARQPCTERYMQHVLHVAPDSSFSVVSLVWTQGQSTSIHDHAGWGVVGVYEGLERETRYRLEGHGPERHLTVTGVTILRPGETTAFVADGLDIHRVDNPADAGPTISIHVYGVDVRARGTSIKNSFDHLPVVEKTLSR